MLAILTAAPLKGSRTYILMGLAAVTIIVQFLVGDHTLQEAAGLLWQLFMAGGVAAARSAIN